MAESAIKNTILIAIDDSKQAEEAFEFYADHLHKEGNTLLLVHVMEEPPSSIPWSSRGNIVVSLVEQAKQIAKKLEKKYVDKMEERNLKGTIKAKFVNKRVWLTLTTEAEERDAKLVVMGSRGMGWLRRTILGSVSQDVLHHAHCPVVICRKQSS